MSKRKTGAGTLIKFRGGQFTFADGTAPGGGFTYPGGSCGSYYAKKASYEDAVEYILQLRSKINQLQCDQVKMIEDIKKVLGIEEEDNGGY
jgi:hypothetical protein